MTPKTILFADDNATFRVPIASVLIKLGYEVITAIDGDDALQKARTFEGVIHLLLADVEMPCMTGIELAIHLSRERPDTTIVLISGRDPGVPVPKNGWRFLPKHLLVDRLSDRLRDLLTEVEERPWKQPESFAGSRL